MLDCWLHTFHPHCGQDFLTAEVLVDISHHNAFQAGHLLLEGHAILGFTLVVQLMEEACSPLINQPNPVGSYLQLALTSFPHHL